MIVVMRPERAKAEIDAVCALDSRRGPRGLRQRGQERTVIGVVGIDIDRVAHVGTMPGVEQVIRVTKPYKLASLRAPARPDARSRSATSTDRRRQPAAWSWPARARSSRASSSSRRPAGSSARARTSLRGGAFKPRTSPYAFQGLGEEGLKLLAEAREETGLPVVTEMTDAGQTWSCSTATSTCSRSAAATCTTSCCCSAAGQSRKPVLLKRGFGATIEEWLMAAEYMLSAGQPQRDPVRARHPHLRAVHAQHARPVGRAGAARADPPAGHGRPVARHRAQRSLVGRWPWRRPRWAPTD